MLRASFVVLVALGSVASAGVKLAGHHPSWAIAANDRGAVAGESLHMTVHLARSAARQQAFDALLAAQQTPGSPQYHRWLTPAQIGARFGASDADLAAVTSWLEHQGFTVTSVGHARTSIAFSGTSDQAARAFAVEMHRYAVAGKTLMAIDREPTVPTELAKVVTSISGLAQRDIRPMHVLGAHPELSDMTGAHYIGAKDFGAIYDLGPAVTNGLTGTGQVIGVIGRARVLTDDVTNYAALMKVTLPTPTVIIPPGGMDPGDPCANVSCACTNHTCSPLALEPAFDDQLEATLDVLRAGAVAPGAKLELIVSSTVGDDDGLDIALEFAIDTYKMPSGADANIINLSFGSCEDLADSTSATQLDTLYQQAAMQGQSVFVSSGDSGAAGCQPSGSPQVINVPEDANVNVLGSSSSVTCLGGTELNDASAESTYWDGSGAAVGYIPEGAWNESLAYAGEDEFVQIGGGGGESQFYAKPTFQTGLGSAASTHRLVPDISFVSEEGEGYAICIAGLGASCAADTNFSYFPVGGTSAAAPDMAGVTALLDQSVGASQGNLNPTLYMLAKDPTNKIFHDVTVATSGVASCDVGTPSMCNNTMPGPASPTAGATIGYAVGPGYDEATGLGSVDISQLISHWPGATALPMLSIDPTSVTVMAGHEVTVALTPSGFTATPTFACSTNLPRNASCAFDNTQLTISVPQATGGVTDTASRLWILLLPAALALVTFARGRWRTSRRLVLALTVSSVLSCGGSSSSSNGPDAGDVMPATPITVTVTITATSGAQSATAPLQLTVD